jgi:hypothetical protein
VPNGVACCVNLSNSMVGYLCAYGANRQPAGCGSHDQIADFCSGVIVRCQAGG